MRGGIGTVAGACVTLTVWPATVSVAVRAVSAVFAAIAKAVAPVPGPDPVSVIQEAPLDEDHAHPDCVVTAIEPLPLADAWVMVRGFTVNVQAAAASVTVKVLPAIVSVADLDDVVVLAAAVYPTLPLPLPLAPLVIVTHEAPVAVQVHPLVVVTATVPLPPVAVSDRLAGEMVYVQAAAASVTVKVLPAIVSVADLDDVVVLAAAVYPTLPLPLPLAPLVIVTHEAPVAVQVHPLVVVTATVPLPPAAVSDRLAGEMVYAHAPACVTVKVLPATVSVPVRDAVAVLAVTLNADGAVPGPRRSGGHGNPRVVADGRPRARSTGCDGAASGAGGCRERLTRGGDRSRAGIGERERVGPGARVASTGADRLDTRLVQDAGRESGREQGHEVQADHPVASRRGFSEIDRLQRRCAAGQKDLQRIARENRDAASVNRVVFG